MWGEELRVAGVILEGVEVLEGVRRLLHVGGQKSPRVTTTTASGCRRGRLEVVLQRRDLVDLVGSLAASL